MEEESKDKGKGGGVVELRRHDDGSLR